MSLTNAVLKAGATSLAVTGGSDITFGPDGQAVANGLHVSVAADTDFRTRRNITFKNKVPTLQSDGTYTKAKRSATYVRPKLLASGKTSFDLVRIEVESHPESTVAENLDFTMVGAQLLSDADFAAFWASGNLS